MKPAGRDVPTMSEALETLQATHGGAYDISRSEDGRWTAVRIGDGEKRTFTGHTPRELEAALRTDWAREGTL